MYICYKAYLYIELLCIKAYCIAFFSADIFFFFFFKPQLFYLKNYLNEAGLFLGHDFEGNYALSFLFTLISKMYMYTQLK